MEAIRDAVGLFRRHRELRKYLWQPLLISIPSYIAIWALTAWLLLPPLQGLALRFNLPWWVGNLAFMLFWFFISGTVFITIAAMLSGHFWEALSRRVEEIEAGKSEAGRLGAIKGNLDGLARTFFSMMMLGCGAIVGWIIPVIGPLAFVAFIASLDFTAPAMARRGYTLRPHIAKVLRIKDILPFAILAGFASGFPFINVLLLPVLVAAGTLTVVRHERARGSLAILPPPLPNRPAA